MSFKCCSVSELDQFLAITSKGISSEVPEGSYDALVDVMAHLGGVRDRLNRTDAMFSPLAATIQLIKSYSLDLPETIHLLLQVRLGCVIVMRSAVASTALPLVILQ